MRNRCQSGFTLLEVVVAFTIFALSFAAILQIFSQRMQSAEISDEYGVALGYAESLLARAGVESDLVAGDQQGEFASGMHWERRVTAYGNSNVDAGSVPLFCVDVSVKWGEAERERAVRLTTLRLSTPR